VGSKLETEYEELFWIRKGFFFDIIRVRIITKYYYLEMRAELFILIKNVYITKSILLLSNNSFSL